MVRVVPILLLVLILGFAPSLHADPTEFYVGGDGESIQYDPAQAEHRAKTRAERDDWSPGRAAIENLGLLALAAGWYWVYKDLNSVDWDFDANFRTFGERLTSLDTVRLDTNRFFVNQGHVLAGATSYTFNRSNNLGPFTSLGFTMVFSTLWEYVFEFREYVSLNDLVTSPFGGQAFGEALYKLGELNRCRSDELSPIGWGLTALFAGPRAMHQAMDDDDDRYDSCSIHHRFRLAATASTLSDDDSDDRLGTSGIDLATEVVDLPGYNRPGTFDSAFADGNFTRIDFESEFSPRGSERLTLEGTSLLFGYYRQRIDQRGDGWRFHVGGARGAWFEVVDQAPVDKLAMVDLMGPDVFFETRREGLRLGIGGRAGFGLGSVYSPSFARRSSTLPADQFRSELAAEGYYFGWGLSYLPRVEIGLGTATVSWSARGGLYSQIQGPDRIHGSDVPRKLRLRDHLFHHRLRLRWQFHEEFDVSGSARWRDRWSWLDGQRTSNVVDAYTMSFGHIF